MADTTIDTRRDDTRSSEEIRQEIRQTRSDMGETVDRLAERISPGQLLDEVWGRVRGDGGEGLGSVVRDHPVPVALMGLGLGWLAVEEITGSSDRHMHDAGPGTYEPAEGRRGPYRGDAVDQDDPEWEHADLSTRARAKAEEARDAASGAVSDTGRKAVEIASGAKDAASGAARSARDAVSGAADSAASKARGLGAETSDRASSTAAEARHAGRRAARKARSGFQELLEDQPLVLGALAFGLGLAGGLAAPSTTREDRLMGRTSETLKDEAGRVARETAGKAKRVASATAEAAADEARRQREERDVQGATRDGLEAVESAAGEVAGEAKEAAREVARAAKEAAQESAEEEDLTAEELKKEARTAGERTAEQAEEDAKRARRES